MTREYSLAGLTKYKTGSGLFWRGRIIWRDGESDGWHHKSTVLTDESGEKIPARPGKDDNRGKGLAEKALERWRAELIEADRRAEQDAAEAAERARREAELAAIAEAEAAKRVLVSDYVTRYIDALEAGNAVEASTVKDYRASSKLICAEFGKTWLQDLKPSMVQAFEIKLTRGEPLMCDGSGEGRKPLGPSTVRKALRLLKTVCEQAANGDEPLILRNPVNGIKPPKAAKAKKNCLDPDSLARLNDYFASHVPTPYVTGAALALYASLRPAEACALRWRNVDLENKTIRIDEAIGYGEGGAYTKAPKVESSRRTINITSQLADVLTRRLELFAKECAAVGIEPNESMFVLGDVSGLYMQPLALSKGWSVIADAEGYSGTKSPRVTFYDLRHSFATIAFAAGADAMAVAAMMGHSNPTITMNAYADAMTHAKETAAQRIEALHKAFSDGGR